MTAPAKLPVECYEAGGEKVFRLPLEVFPGYYAYAHLIASPGSLTLVDTGSGLGQSHQDLLDGLSFVREHHKVPARLEELDRILITHGHIDHFGGLPLVLERARNARVAIHELDKPVLVNYQERVLASRIALGSFLVRAGVPLERRQRLLDLYMMGKPALPSMRVDEALRDGDWLGDRWRVIHVPGHTPGLIMLKVSDILLTADHVLPETSVALAPESILPYTGVGHYIESLHKALSVEDVRLAMGGHERVMPDYYSTVRVVLKASLDKVNRVLAECSQPATIYDIARRVYGTLDGYGELLKLEQTGARMEYLSLRGVVRVVNLEALETEVQMPLEYIRVDGMQR